MDRSLKWRTIALLAGIIGCVLSLAPSIDAVPNWYPMKKKITLGLDLKGGYHFVYSIDLDKAVDDRASDIKRDLDSRFADEKIQATVKTPPNPVGAVTVVLTDANKRAAVEAAIRSDYGDTIVNRACEPSDGPNAICIRVSSDFADGIKKAALTNAVSTIRTRIDKLGVAEPTVVEKGDQIIVELPGYDKKDTESTRNTIGRTAKLEFKVVDDPLSGDREHYMNRLAGHLNPDDTGLANEPTARREGIYAVIEGGRQSKAGKSWGDTYLYAHDREETVPDKWTNNNDCENKREEADSGKVRCTLKGWQIVQRYLFGDKELGVVGLLESKPALNLPDDHQIAYEREEPRQEAKDKRIRWRTYYLERAVRLTGSSIADAQGGADPNTNQPVVYLDFNRFGGRVFGDLTGEIVGRRLAAVLDDQVKSAPVINERIPGGRASITMGGGTDIRRAERERDDLVTVLKSGSLAAPLKHDSEAKLGATLGQDAIDKTKLSFGLGILLVIVIMVGVYRWSGWVAVFAVMFHVLVTLAVMALFGATLTLPGIAALVLSVGMCVDGNILINERIRDELLLGKSVRGAVDLGFSRAFSAILDGQLTIAASAWVLLQYGSGPIKGFAVMMLVGVFTTIATNTWVTRILFDWGVSRKKGATTLSI